MLSDNLEKHRYSDNKNLAEDKEMKIDPTKNTVVCGDNLEWLNWLDNETIDLCYIDPPFFSGQDKDIVWKNGSELRSFGDKFKGDVRYYIEWIEPRLELIKEKLKKTGSIFLHCDHHASHRLRCSLDKIFGSNCFVNEIIWKRTVGGGNTSKNQFGVTTDTIFYYTKSISEGYFDIHYEKYDDSYLKSHYSSVDKKGRPYQFGDMTSPSYNPNTIYEYKGYKPPKNGWRWTLEKMKEMDEKGCIYFPEDKTKRLRQIRYLDEQKGVPFSNLWCDIPPVNSQAKERIGYPTQKPEALIKRIIECASKEEDVVLDCFSGGGTTAKVCADLNRRFIVGDVSPVAVRVCSTRLHKSEFNKFDIINLAKTKGDFRAMDGVSFEKYICELQGWKYTGGPGDGTQDGITSLGEPVQIKNWEKAVGPSEIKEFFGALVQRSKKKGYYVSWKYTTAALSLIAQFNQDNNVKIEALYCEEILKSVIISPEKSQEYNSIFDELSLPEWKDQSLQKSA